MKELFEVSFSMKVSASPLSKGLTEPIVRVIEKSIPLLERVAEAAVKGFEREEIDKQRARGKQDHGNSNPS